MRKTDSKHFDICIGNDFGVDARRKGNLWTFIKTLTTQELKTREHFSKDIQMANITNVGNEGNANQNHNEIAPHTC